MLSFVVRRAFLGLLVLTGLSAAAFFFLASQDITLREQPLLPQYWAWLKGIFTGQTLHVFTQPVGAQVPGFTLTMLSGIWHTAIFLAFALVLVFVFGAMLALVAATRQGSALDVVLRALSYFAWGVPAFLLALLVQQAVHQFGNLQGLGPFPIAGWPGSCPAPFGLNAGYYSSCPAAGSGIVYVGNVLRYLLLPSVTLALAFIGLHGRYLRSTLLENLDAPFIATARAKGLTERRVVLRHALRVSLPVFVSAVLSDAGAIFGTALAVDVIFAVGGLGTVFFNEFPNPVSDSPVLNTLPLTMLVVLAGAFMLLSSFLAELAVFSLDPRMRESL